MIFLKENRELYVGMAYYRVLSLHSHSINLHSVKLMYDFDVRHPSLWSLMPQKMEDLRTLLYIIISLLYSLTMATIGMRICMQGV